jgi:hypothetical protein
MGKLDHGYDGCPGFGTFGEYFASCVDWRRISAGNGTASSHSSSKKTVQTQRIVDQFQDDAQYYSAVLVPDVHARLLVVFGKLLTHLGYACI